MVIYTSMDNIDLKKEVILNTDVDYDFKLQEYKDCNEIQENSCEIGAPKWSEMLSKIMDITDNEESEKILFEDRPKVPKLSKRNVKLTNKMKTLNEILLDSGISNTNLIRFSDYKTSHAAEDLIILPPYIPERNPDNKMRSQFVDFDLDVEETISRKANDKKSLNIFYNDPDNKMSSQFIDFNVDVEEIVCRETNDKKSLNISNDPDLFEPYPPSKGSSCSGNKNVFVENSLDINRKNMNILKTQRKQVFRKQAKVDAKLITIKWPRPLISYSCLIGLAIRSSQEEVVVVNTIYNFVSTFFPYFKTAPQSWKNCIRHNLSLSKFFDKVDEEKSKNSFWTINPAHTFQLYEHILKYYNKDRAYILEATPYPEHLDEIVRFEMKFKDPNIEIDTEQFIEMESD